MDITCRDRERIFADGSPEEWLALEAHAASCKECGEELSSWKRVSLAAQELKEEWDSPALWPRIARGLKQQSQPQDTWLQKWLDALRVPGLSWQAAAATVVLLLVTGSSAWLVLRERGSVPKNAALLNRRAVSDVERAEAAYVRAIDKLDVEARPQLDNPSSPLIANYREKLLVLDSAIAELRSQADQNPANGHLRRQLLAMYQEKQDTLEQVLEEKR